MASSLTNALFSALTLSRLSVDQAGVAGVLWSGYFLAIAFAKGSSVFNGKWVADKWSPWSPDVMAIAILPGLIGATVLTAVDDLALALVCLFASPGLVLLEIVRQQSLVDDGLTAVQLDVTWLLLSLGCFFAIWVAAAWSLELMFAAWAGSALAALLLTSARIFTRKPSRTRHLVGATGAEHLISGSAFSLLTIMTGLTFGLAAVSSVRLVQLVTTPLRLAQAAAQPVLFGQHLRCGSDARNLLRRQQTLVLVAGWTVLVGVGAISVSIWPAIVGSTDIVVSWPVFGWYALILLGNVGLMATAAALRAEQRTKLLLSWRLGGLALTITAFLVANDIATALALIALGSALIAGVVTTLAVRGARRPSPRTWQES